ncbi:MAG: hypothetical protein IZT59_05655 [Verrucomicrobia bacterium]|jgi:hypothetical protein|nr:hypothetical protein [Verrucomicrobiota bacterium]|tara:strand:- start:31369 stop:32019 length:651 start_codon:yes stop_codon:yes gene_type:complete
MRAFLTSLVVFFSLLRISQGATVFFEKHIETEGGPRTWAYELGVAFITPNEIENFLFINDTVSRADGPAGGEIYTFTASRRLGQLVWKIGDHTFTPQLELPFTMELVNENAGNTFMAFAGSFNVRWIDFPWNDYVKTSFSMGVGLNYSDEIYLMDQIRHPGNDRSRLKFNWPIQATFAFSDYPDDQLMLFIIHHSGGRLFDHGGLNALGIGYRRDF